MAEEFYLDVVPNSGQWWIIIEREERNMFIGPWLTEAGAVHALDNSLLVDAECEENALDCYASETDPNLDTDEVVLIDHNDPDHTGKETNV